MGGVLFGEATDETLTKMYNDVDIRSAINTIVKEIQGRKLTLKSKNENDRKIQEINARLSKVDFNSLIDWTMQSKWFRFSVTEVLWGDNYNITGIKRQLRDYFDLRLEDNEYVWYHTFDMTPVPFYKAIISQNDPDDVEYYGKTDFQPLLKLFAIKENTVEAVNSIIKKYGGVITWFTYNPDSDEDTITALIDDASNISNETVIPIPARANGSQGYNKDFGFVPLTDLDTSVHLALENWIEKEISKYFLGGTLTQDVGSSGSYAASQTHQEVREDIIRGHVAFLENEFKKLIYIDSVFYGYDSENYYYELTNPEDESLTVKVTQEKANIIKTVSENYDVSIEYVSEYLGIPIEYLSKKEVQVQGMAFSKEYAQTVQSKKKALDKAQLDRVYTSIDDNIVKKKVVDPLSEAMIAEVEKIKNINDLNKINVVFPKEFLQFLTIANLQGQLDIINQSKLSKVKEFANEETIDLFNLPYDEAIKYLQEKIPSLYDDIEEITAANAQKYFWVKKSTSLELTKKMQNDLIHSLKEGISFKEWTKTFNMDLYNSLGITNSGSYTETVYRTNVQNAYSAGRFERQERQAVNFPYWQYNSLMDSVTTEICTQLNDKVYRSDDPIWKEIYPPSHYNCRSSVIAYSQDDIIEDNLTVISGDADKQTDVYKQFQTTSFAGNPKTSEKSTMTSLIKDKEKAIKENAKIINELMGE